MSNNVLTKSRNDLLVKVYSEELLAPRAGSASVAAEETSTVGSCERIVMRVGIMDRMRRARVVRPRYITRTYWVQHDADLGEVHGGAREPC